MLKWTALFFFLGLAGNAHAQEYATAETVLGAGDTVVASFHLADTTIGDTAYFGMEADGGVKGGLRSYFEKNLRPPASGDSSTTGNSRVFFVLDKTGRVTQAWYDPKGNTDVGLMVLQVVNQLPPIRPTSIKGEAVITKVILNVQVRKEGHSYTGTFQPDISIAKISPHSVN